eukprot:CFRG3426T1
MNRDEQHSSRTPQHNNNLVDFSGCQGITPNGIRLFDNYLTKVEQSSIVEELKDLMSGVVDGFTLQAMNARAEQELASRERLSRKMKCLHGIPQLEALPNTYAAIQRVEKTGVFSGPVDSIQINEYSADQGCAMHVDAPSIGPVIGMFSLESSVVMHVENNKISSDKGTILLTPRSCLLFSDDLRQNWLHGIDSQPIQFFKDETIVRDHRFSVVFWSTPTTYEGRGTDRPECTTVVKIKTPASSKRRLL